MTVISIFCLRLYFTKSWNVIPFLVEFTVYIIEQTKLGNIKKFHNLSHFLRLNHFHSFYVFLRDIILFQRMSWLLIQKICILIYICKDDIQVLNCKMRTPFIKTIFHIKKTHPKLSLILTMKWERERKFALEIFS